MLSASHPSAVPSVLDDCGVPKSTGQSSAPFDCHCSLRGERRIEVAAERRRNSRGASAAELTSGCIVRALRRYAALISVFVALSATCKIEYKSSPGVRSASSPLPRSASCGEDALHMQRQRQPICDCGSINAVAETARRACIVAKMMGIFQPDDSQLPPPDDSHTRRLRCRPRSETA